VSTLSCSHPTAGSALISATSNHGTDRAASHSRPRIRGASIVGGSTELQPELQDLERPSAGEGRDVLPSRKGHGPRSWRGHRRESGRSLWVESSTLGPFSAQDLLIALHVSVLPRVTRPGEPPARAWPLGRGHALVSFDGQSGPGDGTVVSGRGSGPRPVCDRLLRDSLAGCPVSSIAHAIVRRMAIGPDETSARRASEPGAIMPQVTRLHRPPDDRRRPRPATSSDVCLLDEGLYFRLDVSASARVSPARPSTTTSSSGTTASRPDARG
jgi:hypothetical protein